MSRGRQWNIKKTLFSQENGFYLKQFLRLVNEKINMNKPQGLKKDITWKYPIYTEIPVYTCIYKKEMKINRLYLLKIICKKAETNTQV